MNVLAAVVIVVGMCLPGCSGCSDPAVLRIDGAAADISNEPDSALPDAVVAEEDAPAAVDTYCVGTSPSCTTAPTTVLSAPISNEHRLSNMAIVEDTLYMSTADLENPGSGFEVVAGRVTSVDLVGGTQATLLPGTVEYSVWAADGWLYAAEYTANGTIWRLKPGVAPVALVTGRPTPHVVTADATHVYWTETLDSTTDVVKRRLISGGTVETVMNCRSAWALIVDDLNVYCEEFNQSLLRAPKAGATAVSIASSSYPYTGMVRCAQSLYATNVGQLTIQAVPMPDGPGSTFATVDGIGRFYGIAASAAHFYATPLAAGIVRVSRADATYDVIAPDEASEGTPVLWNGQLFFYNRDIGVRRCVD
jgi:hypothetical protein